MTPGKHCTLAYGDLTFFVLCIALAVLFAALSGCVAPGSGWTAANDRAVEVGLVTPFREQPALALEFSAEVRRDHGRTQTGSHLHQSPEGVASKPTAGPTDDAEPLGSTYGRWDFSDVRGRAGLRWQALPALALAAGTSEQLGPYARVVLERRVTPRCAIGVALVSDRGEEILFGIRWSH